MEINNFKLDNIFDKKLHTFVNPYSYYVLEESKVYLDEFKIYSDGILLVEMYNLLHKDKISRYSFDFTSLAPVIFNYAAENNLKVALIGGTSDEIKKAVHLMENKFKKMNISYYHHGYIKDSFESIIDEIRNSDADIVIAGLGTPMQEEFILECSKGIPNLKFAFTCGGFLSQVSSNENYFHPFFDKLHLRWLQRFFRHSYVRKRVLVDYPKFVLRYMMDNLKNKKNR